MHVEAPTAVHANAIEDSRRWGSVALRPGDIIISTPPKCGTTWTQGIVNALLWPDGDAPGTLGQRSLWPDARFDDIESMVAAVDAIEHRRFLKSHAPADALPYAADVRYLAVYRNPADAFVSWGNHRSDMAPRLMAHLNAMAATEGVAPLPETWDGDWQVLRDEWVAISNPATHLAAWWPRRDNDNVLLVHYADLWADLEGGMRRIAAFLGADVAEPAWPAVVDRCTLSSMRETARGYWGDASGVWKHGVDSFYFKGGNGRGAELLDAGLLADIDAMVDATLPADAARWLRSGGPLPD